MTKAQVKAAKARAADQAAVASEAVAVAIDNLHMQVADQPVAEASESQPVKLIMRDGKKLYAAVNGVELTLAGTKGLREYVTFSKPTTGNAPQYRAFIDLMVNRKVRTARDLFATLCREAGAPVPTRATRTTSNTDDDETLDL